MTFTPEFNSIAAIYFGVVEMNAVHGRTMVTYEDGTTHDLGDLNEYPMQLHLTGLTVSVDNKKLIISNPTDEIIVNPNEPGDGSDGDGSDDDSGEHDETSNGAGEGE